MPINEDQPEIIISNEGGNPEASVPARIDDVLPDKLLLLPLKARPFFPAQTMPLLVDDTLWRETLERVGDTPHKLVGLVYAHQKSDDGVAIPEEFSLYGTVARIHHPTRGAGHIQFIAEGIERFRITHWIHSEPPYLVQAEYARGVLSKGMEERAYALAIINKIKELLPLNPLYKESLKAFLERFRVRDKTSRSDPSCAVQRARLYRVVPLAMKSMGSYLDRFHFGVGYLAPFVVPV